MYLRCVFSACVWHGWGCCGVCGACACVAWEQVWPYLPSPSIRQTSLGGTSGEGEGGHAQPKLWLEFKFRDGRITQLSRPFDTTVLELKRDLAVGAI